MLNKSVQPILRFKGFSGGWKQSIMGDVTDVYDGTHQTPQYTNSGVMFLSVENIATLSSKKYISQEDFKNEFKIYPQKNDVLMTRIGDVGTANVVNTDEPKAYYVSLALLKFKETNPYFLVSAISSNTVAKNLWHRTLHIAFPKKINMGEIKKVELLIPTETLEQTKIGEYFQQLDKLINTHQKKHSKLQNIKKAMLKKMFPQPGQSVPEIRFKGFSGEWGENKLTEVANYRNGKAHEGAISKNGKFTVVNSKFVSTNGEVKKFSNEQIEPLFVNEICFVLSDVPNGRAIARTFLVKDDKKYTLNQRIAGITPLEHTSSYFLHLLLNRNPYFLSFDDGAKQTNLSKQDVEDFTALYPSSPEQEKIGSYFKSLDDLISQHNKQIQKLQNIKQACLSKMFV